MPKRLKYFTIDNAPVSRYFPHILLIYFFAVFVPSVYAQPTILPDSVSSDTSVTVILPAAAYASDLGLVGGMMINRYRYHPLSTPFVSVAEFGILASTKGMVDAQVRYEHTELFGRPIRSRWTLYGQRYPVDNYFGIGNNTAFDTDAWKDDFYFYEARRIGMEWIGRNTIYRPEYRRGQIDLKATFVTDYEISKAHDERLMGQKQPNGFDGGWVSAVGIGMIWENRNNEYDATRGNRFELSGEWAPGLILGDFTMASVSSEYRHFMTLPIPYFRPVLAGRIAGKWATGDLPYWKRPYLGDNNTLRGYPIYRFRGDASLFYNLELRTWIYENPFLDFKFGIHGFHDAGRVFYDENLLKQAFRDYHRTFGGGVASSLLTPDFIVRMDIGFSNEMYRLYMNIGYMF